MDSQCRSLVAGKQCLGFEWERRTDLSNQATSKRGMAAMTKQEFWTAAILAEVLPPTRPVAVFVQLPAPKQPQPDVKVPGTYL